jgi:hypothetical protein
MKLHVALLTLTLAVLSPAAENSPFYLPIRNNDLAALGKLIQSPGPKARDAAAAWLEKAEPLTTEDRIMQILGIVWAGRKPPSNRVRQLISQQRAGGGWGQTGNLPSDAYATGEALWALHESGMTPSDAVYRRGVDYLLGTQQQDGTWHVVTRALGFQPYFESGFPHGHDQWISQSGTAMASIALTFAVTLD